MNRLELVKYIKFHDSMYADFDFKTSYYTDEVLRGIVKRIQKDKNTIEWIKINYPDIFKGIDD